MYTFEVTEDLQSGSNSKSGHSTAAGSAQPEAQAVTAASQCGSAGGTLNATQTAIHINIDPVWTLPYKTLQYSRASHGKSLKLF